MNDLGEWGRLSPFDDERETVATAGRWWYSLRNAPLGTTLVVSFSLVYWIATIGTRNSLLQGSWLLTRFQKASIYVTPIPMGIKFRVKYAFYEKLYSRELFLSLVKGQS